MRAKAAVERKHPLIDVELTRLHLDPNNPRLPEECQGKKEPELLAAMDNLFFLDELATSFAENGYFLEEPLIAVPARTTGVPQDDEAFELFVKDRSTQLVVVEGNRRLAALKILLDSSTRESRKLHNWPRISEALTRRLSQVPAIIYRLRHEVLPYLGVRHIAGIRKWDSFAKARYIAGMRTEGFSISDIEEQIGGRQDSARKLFICYQLVQTAKKQMRLDITAAKENFSYLLLAINQGPIKEFLGWPSKIEEIDVDRPIARGRRTHFGHLFTWLYGNGGPPVIGESRDITRFLAPILKSEQATKKLVETRDLRLAYDYSGGEEGMLLDLITEARRRLERALTVVGRHKTTEVKGACARAREAANRLAHGAGCEDA